MSNERIKYTYINTKHVCNPFKDFITVQSHNIVTSNRYLALLAICPLNVDSIPRPGRSAKDTFGTCKNRRSKLTFNQKSRLLTTQPFAFIYFIFFK